MLTAGEYMNCSKFAVGYAVVKTGKLQLKKK